MIQNYLPHLHYFWLTAKFSSFTRAAEYLRISQSAVSFQIKTLEEKLERQLFLREAKNRVVLSPDGLNLFQHCQRIFLEAEAGLNQLLSKKPEGALTVSAPPNFGSFVLVSMLPLLRKKYPKLNVSLNLTDSYVDMYRENVDLCIRWGATRDSKLTYEYVMDVQHVLVASRQYLKTHSKITKPKDIEKHCCLVRRMDPLIGGWRNWFSLFPENGRPRFQETISIESTYGLTVAVRESLGISVLPVYAVYDDLKKRVLKELLPKYNKQLLEPFYACYPKSPYPSAKIAAFITTLREYLSVCCGKKGFVSRPKNG